MENATLAIKGQNLPFCLPFHTKPPRERVQSLPCSDPVRASGLAAPLINNNNNTLSADSPSNGGEMLQQLLINIILLSIKKLHLVQTFLSQV